MAQNINARVSPLLHCVKKAYLSATIAKSPLLGQWQNYTKLTKAIHRQELTKSLNFLQKAGYTSNSAIFILPNLQASLEVA
ncbi:hypothetical protein [Anabaena azotica]|uniref:Uncharacterized protein n=1 Tax=Anabaena azotica FACHB-119 TaxID=947527 RepID=A0ABR8DH85_9NOST|nr:hypothetical protein [Anabaena azotica]MBD2505461.1 hypothetical protein [Anabaena azotica FACHB-119]